MVVPQHARSQQVHNLRACCFTVLPKCQYEAADALHRALADPAEGGRAEVEPHPFSPTQGLTRKTEPPVRCGFGNRSGLAGHGGSSVVVTSRVTSAVSVCLDSPIWCDRSLSLPTVGPHMACALACWVCDTLSILRQS